MKRAVLALSGGMDSTSLLIHLLANGYSVQGIGIDYGQKHRFELDQATKLCSYLRSAGFAIQYNIITITGLSELLVSGLIDNNSMDLLKGHYAHENAKTTVVPNRNAILSSIAYAVALSTVRKNDERCLIALATHMGDYDNNLKQGIYPDCSEEFKLAIEHAFKIGNWDSEKVDYYAPYNSTDKTGVLKDGVDKCAKLGLSYQDVYVFTNTSYCPVQVNGRWFSDFKTGSSIERIEAFTNLGLRDPIQYVDDDGEMVEWEHVVDYVSRICNEWKRDKIK